MEAAVAELTKAEEALASKKAKLTAKAEDSKLGSTLVAFVGRVCLV